jgi:hypothetical protein
MKLAASRELYAYWSRLRGARSAPERSEIDPAAIRGILGDTFILEVDLEAGYPFRIAGARTSSLFQRELRGGRFLDLWSVAARSEIVDMLATVTDEATAVIGGVSAKPAGFLALELEMLLLPLRHHGATHSRILGLCSASSSPNWLGLTPVAQLSLLSTRALRTGDEGSGLAAAKGAPASPQLDAIARQIRLGRFTLFSGAERRS